jgi:hypothetical protein
MPMPLNKNKMWPKDLIKISVQKIVFDGGHETRISSHQIVLVPEEINHEYFLVLFVDGIRLQKNWKLSAQAHHGKLRHGGRITTDEIFYVHGLNDNRRYRFLYCNPKSLQIGTRGEFQLRYHRSRSQRAKKDRDMLDYYQQLFGKPPPSVAARKHR